MKELVLLKLIQDIEYLTAKKTQNEKNSHVLTDAVEKMQTGIVLIVEYHRTLWPYTSHAVIVGSF